MKTILIATDGSPSSQEAVQFGLELAEEQGATPVFVHVAPAVDVLPTGGFGLTAAVPHQLSEYDWSPLNNAAALASELGIEAKTGCCAATRPARSSPTRTRSAPT
jgi:nucleotide-binding universal stress UspA family protein